MLFMETPAEPRAPLSTTPPPPPTTPPVDAEAPRHSQVVSVRPPDLRDLVAQLTVEPAEQLEPRATLSWISPTGEPALLGVVRLSAIEGRGGYVHAVVRVIVQGQLAELFEFVYPRGARVELAPQGDNVILTYEDVEYDRWVPFGWSTEEGRLFPLDAPSAACER